jgi:carboxyl-terminal processing protease
VTLLIPLLVLALGGTTIEPCEALREYDGITAVVTEKFYDRNFRGLNWPSRVAFYRKKVKCNVNSEAVATAANELLSELHASHTGVYTSDQLEYWALQSIFSPRLDAYQINDSGIWPRFDGHHWFARYILPGSPAENVGVRTGDELISIDGHAFDPLGFKSATASQLTVSSDGRNRRTVAITAIRRSVEQSFLDATNADRMLIPLDSGEVGYFHLWTGTNPLFLQAMNQGIAMFEDAHVVALIIDLRGGYGGANLDYISALKGSQSLRGIPKVLLIDEGVRSGKEWVAGVMKHEGIATLVGSKTAGAFLGGMANHLFGDKYFLYVAGGAFVPPDVGPIEGIGIEPDVPVSSCWKYCNGADPQLDQALELLRQRLSK